MSAFATELLFIVPVHYKTESVFYSPCKINLKKASTEYPFKNTIRHVNRRKRSSGVLYYNNEMSSR